MASALPFRGRTQTAIINAQPNDASTSSNGLFQDPDRARFFLQSDDPKDDEPGLPLTSIEQFLGGHRDGNFPTEKTARRLQTYESEFLMNRTAATQR
jgi:hypothetical protein